MRDPVDNSIVLHNTFTNDHGLTADSYATNNTSADTVKQI